MTKSETHGLQHSSFPLLLYLCLYLWTLLKLISIASMMPSNHLILCCSFPLLSSIFPSIRVFSNESTLCIKWPKYWSFSFSISLYNEHSGVISLRIDWFDILAVQGTLKISPVPSLQGPCDRSLKTEVPCGSCLNWR